MAEIFLQGDEKGRISQFSSGVEGSIPSNHRQVSSIYPSTFVPLCGKGNVNSILSICVCCPWQVWHLPRSVVSFLLRRGSQESELRGDPGPPLWQQGTLEASDPALEVGPRGRSRGRGSPRPEQLQHWRPHPPCMVRLHRTGRQKFFMAIFYTAILMCPFLTNCTDSRGADFTGSGAVYTNLAKL